QPSDDIDNTGSENTFDWRFVEDPNDANNDDIKTYYDHDLRKFVVEVNTCSPDAKNRIGNFYPRYAGKLDPITGHFDAPANDRDVFRGRKMLDGSVCNYSISDDFDQFAGVCGDGYKEERRIRIFDWCEGTSNLRQEIHYLVKVGDFEALSFKGCAEELDTDTYSGSDWSRLIRDLNRGTFTVPSNVCITVSTGPTDCTASINTNLSQFGDIIDDNCGLNNVTVEVISYGPELVSGFPTGRDVWKLGGYVRQGSMIVGLSLGKHALIITADDECYNSNKGILFFEVVDKVKPIMKCDDELRVTLSDGDANLGIKGYALVTYENVDEGSWDNCSLEKLEVRRFIGNNPGAISDWEALNGKAIEEEYDSMDPDRGQYTGWDNVVEFFCADVGNPVRVELRGTDNGKATGAYEDNQSICWLNVDIENGLNYNVQLEGGGMITCDQTITQENVYDFISINQWGMQCEGPAVGVRIEPNLDECGFGEYLVYLDVAGGTDSKNGSYVDPYPVSIQVKEVHDYWIKFPADESLSCGEIEDYNGVTTSETEDVACDLLAIYKDENPQRFFAAGAGCYKIFQTYKVINWCEYDGESLPVIVSRDWDAHNANTCYDFDRIDPNFDNANRLRQLAAGEYNLNPQEPDGDGDPGDEDIYVIVEINNLTGLYNPNTGKNDGGPLATVYFDNDNNPRNNSTANLFGDNDSRVNNGISTLVSSNVDRIDEGYWWAVTREPSACNETSAWYDNDGDGNFNNPQDPGFDIDGNDFQDDSDNRYGSSGYWQYTQHIVVYDDTAPTVDDAFVTVANGGSTDNATCDAEVELTVEVSDECSVEDIVVEVFDGSTRAAIIKADAGLVINSSRKVTATWAPSAALPIGEYKWTIEVNDGCGNTTRVDVEFEVKDEKSPAPICHDDIRVDLMPTTNGAGMAAVWASDFKASDIGDCSGQDDVYVTLDGTAGNTARRVSKDAYSIYREEGFTDANYVSPYEDETVRGLILTCDDLASDGSNGLVKVRIYAEDAEGNWGSYCSTYIEVQNNNGACGVPAVGEIAGLIYTENVETVEGVEVQLSGSRSMMYMTNHDGSYGFNSLVIGGDYTILPNKDDDYKNGVSTRDLIQMQKHILGIEFLDSPYKMIAADINNSKTISTLDLIQLRKLILNIDAKFANNTSWRFVDSDYRFADESNPWLGEFPEVHNVNNLDRTVLANFVAVKIGDVNGSVQANNALDVEPRNIADVVELHTEEVDLRMGNEYTVSFSADLNEVAGFQFTMELDPQQVEILDLKEGLAKSENFGVFTTQGLITSSFQSNVQTQVNGEVLFSLKLRAKADAKLSEVLGLSSRYTEAEAYGLKDEGLALGLVIGDQTTESGFNLYQNTPNPFKAETIISFKLPEFMEGVLEFKDISGRTILLKEGNFAKGYNEVSLNADELPSAGVYFYTLQAGKYTATKKIILVK
ncbi:MAG: T9SS type A sorting domain-containing protein, partial [Bacteroidota bacterium]